MTLTQTLLDYCHDNLENRLEMVVDIESPDGTIYASDRNKYVGGTFYEALLNFPVIGRTVGEWLSPDLQFSTLTLELSNVDGRFNNYLPSGSDFGGWIGKSVTVRLGLAEVASTYTTVFRGRITDVGGFKRSTKSITIIARDNYDRINVNFPSTAFTEAAYPKIEVKNIGKLMPVIYGDWTVDNEPNPASVPAWVTNGNDPYVHFKEKDLDVDVGTNQILATNHDLDDNDIVQFTTTGTLPAPLNTGVNYYVINANGDDFKVSATMGGAEINITTAGTGDHKYMPDPAGSRLNVKLRISENDLQSFDQGNVYLKRGDVYMQVPSSQITNIGAGNKTFEIQQNTGTLWVSTDAGNIAYLFDASDQFYVRVVGKDLGAYTGNMVWIARDILMTYGGVVSGDFHANWTTYRDKSSPAESAVANILGRVWVQDAKQAMTYALQMLEQIRLEAFIDRDLKIKINSLHFDDFNDAPTFVVKNWDVEKDSFKTTIDERNNFNRAQGFYAFSPVTNENGLQTKIYNNPDSITQMGKAISKKIEFPNLYKAEDVELQLVEILKLASATLEIIELNLTWRSLLRDIGEFISIDVKIGSSIFDEVPAMIRDIGYDPTGLKIPVKLWSMMMVPFPGYEPGFAGTVGGYNANIVEE
jgi:hypothetical protein